MLSKLISVLGKTQEAVVKDIVLQKSMELEKARAPAKAASDFSGPAGATPVQTSAGAGAAPAPAPKVPKAPKPAPAAASPSIESTVARTKSALEGHYKPEEIAGLSSQLESHLRSGNHAAAKELVNSIKTHVMHKQAHGEVMQHLHSGNWDAAISRIDEHSKLFPGQGAPTVTNSAEPAPAIASTATDKHPAAAPGVTDPNPTIPGAARVVPGTTPPVDPGHVSKLASALNRNKLTLPSRAQAVAHLRQNQAQVSPAAAVGAAPVAPTQPAAPAPQPAPQAQAPAEPTPAPAVTNSPEPTAAPAAAPEQAVEQRQSQTVAGAQPRRVYVKTPAAKPMSAPKAVAAAAAPRDQEDEESQMLADMQQLHDSVADEEPTQEPTKRQQNTADIRKKKAQEKQRAEQERQQNEQQIDSQSEQDAASLKEQITQGKYGLFGTTQKVDPKKMAAEQELSEKRQQAAKKRKS